MKGERNIKTLAKEAKKRLKNGFWEKYGKDVKASFSRARSQGVDPVGVIDYYEAKAAPKKNDGDEFYRKVKKILDEYGERGNAISMLIDYSVYDSLDYGRKQKYVLDLSERYRAALERYKREKTFGE